MKKRILITSTDLMMIQFLVPHVKNLAEHGYKVEIACSEVGGRMEEVRKSLSGYVSKLHLVRLVRSPASVKNLKGYGDLRRVIESGDYDIIWTNEPVMGVMTRLAAIRARRSGMKVIYMVHGFHFYCGAPIKYWLAFFPIEKVAGYFCDSVVTVNREDYSRAKKMKLPNVKYIHGIGINTDRLKTSDNHNIIRKELGLDENAFLVLSVGELNRNKNQKTIMYAIAKLRDPDIHYVLCGKGSQSEKLEKLAGDLGIARQVHFLGYRKDVVNICSQSDVFVMSSYREGLPVASLEAMYCGLPLVTSNIRGLVDIQRNGKTGYLCEPDDVDGFAKSIRVLRENSNLKKEFGARNKKIVQPYCLENVKVEVLNLMEAYSTGQYEI